jgi:hypothetical protein
MPDLPLLQSFEWLAVVFTIAIGAWSMLSLMHAGSTSKKTLCHTLSYGRGVHPAISITSAAFDVERRPVVSSDESMGGSGDLTVVINLQSCLNG